MANDGGGNDHHHGQQRVLDPRPLAPKGCITFSQASGNNIAPSAPTFVSLSVMMHIAAALSSGMSVHDRLLLVSASLCKSSITDAPGMEVIISSRECPK